MLQKLKFTPLTTKEIKPYGWMKRQLEIQGRGLSGNLDKVWPDIKESRWIGGEKEGWERVPYWLDGFIPLAYLLDDEDMKRRAEYYIDSILSSQEEDGWICPCAPEKRARYDIWATFLICKVLVVYYDCTGDGRVEEAIYKALKQMKKHMERNTPFNWAAARWYECLIPLFWLYERRSEDWMLELAVILEVEGIDFETLYEKLDFQKPEEKRYWSYLNHVVNVAMALKSRAMMSRLSKENPSEFAEKFYNKLMKFHSMPTGHFTGDECLAGDMPIQGSECCGVVEAMYSYEWLVSITGENRWADLLERLAYNAFPATITPDMWAHQYDQMTNQMQISFLDNESNPFSHNSGEAHYFGLEPHFGCCTSNFSQAWPKFALSTIMKTENGLAVTAIAPAKANVIVNGVPVIITIETDYPFRDSYKVVVDTEKAVDFELTIRIPGFAKEARINGEAVNVGDYYTVNQIFDGSKTFEVVLNYEITLDKRPSGMYVVNRGPLLYSVSIEASVKPVEYIRNGVERKAPYCDYEMVPAKQWNFAFGSKEFDVEFHKVGDVPFNIEAPAITLTTKGYQIPWEAPGGICTVLPKSLKPMGPPQKLVLQPYGATNLRMTEIPLIQP